MQKVILIITLFALFSCSTPAPTQTTFIRDTTYIIKPPIIREDSVKPQFITDTLIRYIKERSKDTIVDIKYYPNGKVMSYVIKPDTVRLTARDTLFKTDVKEVKQDISFGDKLLYVIIGSVVGIMIFIGIRLANNKG